MRAPRNFLGLVSFPYFLNLDRMFLTQLSLLKHYLLKAPPSIAAQAVSMWAFRDLYIPDRDDDKQVVELSLHPSSNLITYGYLMSANDFISSDQGSVGQMLPF